MVVQILTSTAHCFFLRCSRFFEPPFLKEASMTDSLQNDILASGGYITVIIFYICSLYETNGKNKRTNKTVTKLAKMSLKAQLRISFLINLKLSEVSGIF